MPLDETYPPAVVFVAATRMKEGQEVRSTIGTAFLVSVPSELFPNRNYVYAVTASHVIAGGEKTWLRFNTQAGDVTDMAVPEWFSIDPAADVAVTTVGPLALGLVKWRAVPLEHFLDSSPDLEPHLGDDVYFIGLLAQMRAMVEQNIPMVRSGTLGRLYQTDVPLKRPDGTVFRVTGHLIDCRSYGGFSGSPCFVQFEFYKQVDTPSSPGGPIGNLQHRATLLLGLISGHWDDPHEARPTGGVFQTGTFQYAINTGVGVVTPVESIREALNLEELVDMRRKEDERMKTAEMEEEERMAATPDAAPSEEGLRKQDFDEALRKATRRVEPPESPGT